MPLTTKVTIGTCSICGGRVTVRAVWHGIFPPTPTCNACGAIKADQHDPIIRMTQRGTSVRAKKWPGAS